MNKNDYKDEKTEKLKNKALELFSACKTDMETLQNSRAKALKHYMGGEIGNEIKGRSQLVTSDVADVIEWIMPALMKIFYGGQDVVTIRPQGPEDEIKVKLMEAMVNFDLQKSNNGFKLFYQFFKDALIYKMGVVKYAWEKKIEYKYNDVELDEAGFQALKRNPKYIIDTVEVIQESVINEAGITIIPTEYRVVFRKKEKISRPVFWNVPPEEFIFDMTMKEVTDVEGFICHRRLIGRDHAKAKYNFTDEDIDAEIANFKSDDIIIQQRFKDIGGINFLTPSNDDTITKIYVNECYLYEFDAEGNAIPKIITIIGNRVVRVEDNKYGAPPFCVLSPILLTHRMLGLGYVEGITDIRLARTALLRAIMDNIYYTDNQVRVVNPNRINYADYKSGRIPGGTILTKGDIDPSTAIFNLPSTPLPNQVFKMFETMLPELRADQTGVTKYNQGLDSKSLNKTASGINQIMSAAQQRIELIARVFAETGVKDLVQADIKMNIQFFDTERNLKIDNDWKLVTPDMIDGDYDAIIDVGIGLGSKEIQFNQVSMMLDKYAGIANIIKDPLLIREIFWLPEVKEMTRELWKFLGYKSSDRFLSVDKKIIQGDNGGGRRQEDNRIPNSDGGGISAAARTPQYAAIY